MARAERAMAMETKRVMAMATKMVMASDNVGDNYNNNNE
jgi:hypothetical protein